MPQTAARKSLAIVFLLFCPAIYAQEKSFNIQKQLSQFQLRQLESTRSIVQHVLRIGNPAIQAVPLGQIADAVWEMDPAYGRDLFKLSYEILLPRDDDTEKTRNQKKMVFRKIVSLIAKRDLNWARDLVNRFAGDTNENARTNLDVAENLLESDPRRAAEFADRSLQLEITDGLVSFIKGLRQRNEADANRLFMNILGRYRQQQFQDATQFGLLGTYLFSSPLLDPRDVQSISYTRVGNVVFPNISANLPNVDPSLARTYITDAATIVSRPTDDPVQRQTRFVLGYMMIPKARQFAPEYVGAFSGAMAASASSPDIGDLRSDDAFKNINKTAKGTLDEQIEEIEKNPDPYTRDQLLLNLTHNAWRTEDFPGARKASAKIENKEVGADLETLIQFGEAKSILKRRDNSLADVVPMIERLPPSLEKSILWLAIASRAEKKQQPELASYSLDMALRSSAQTANENMPYILTFISGELAARDTLQSGAVLGEAVRAFNKQDRVRPPSLVHRVSLEPLSMPFPLSMEGVSLNFLGSFQKAVQGREEDFDSIVDEIRDDQLKGDALAALALSILKKKETAVRDSSRQGGGVVRVGEDGIRKSAAKTVMPVYPKESLKRKAAGVVVAEIQYNGEGDVIDVKVIESPDAETGASVVEAMKQWKFTPSRANGKPVSIRGKITFYFTIDAKGRGEVKNPKQYQK